MVDNEMSLTQHCVDLIIDLVRSHKIKAGQKLGEVGMARKLKMGRAPVRSAFDQLARAGLLERISRSGTFVRKVGLEEYCELMDVRAALESMAASLAAVRLTDDELEKLAQLARRVDERSARYAAAEATGKAAPESRREIIELEREFHHIIISASGNRRLAELLETQQLLENCFVVGQSMSLPRGKSSRRLVSHADVVKALRSRNSDAAGSAMLDHLLLSKEQFVAGVTGMR
jgi:DNA-binding GntR family transcriptional regulator